jgi:hypothetical protein
MPSVESAKVPSVESAKSGSMRQATDLQRARRRGSKHSRCRRRICNVGFGGLAQESGELGFGNAHLTRTRRLRASGSDRSRRISLPSCSRPSRTLRAAEAVAAEERPSVTAAVRDGRTILRAGAEEWLRRGAEQMNGQKKFMRE